MSKHSKCWEHGKISFNCEETALRYARYLLGRHGWEMRVYWDDFCDCYHLTADMCGH